MRLNRFFNDSATVEIKAIPIQGVTTGGSKFWVKVSGVWKQAITWVNVSGVWKIATPFYKIGGNWK